MMGKSRLAGVAMCVLLAGALAACGQQQAAKPAVDTAKVADAVLADVHQFVEQFNARDAEGAVSHDAPDYVGMFHGMPNVKGPAEDLVVTRQQVADPAVKVVVSDETVDVAASGDMAVYRATYAYTFTDPTTQQPATENGNWLMGYGVQPDGSWKIAWGVVSDTGPAAVAAPAATEPAAAEPS